MDDYAGDASTTGRYSVSSAPLVIRSDFNSDSDWLKIDRFERFYDYEIFAFLPPDNLDPPFKFLNVEVLDLQSNSHAKPWYCSIQGLGVRT